MKLRFFVFICVCALFCRAQKTQPLFHRLETAVSDTQKINALNALTKAYLDINLDSAVLFNNQALFIAGSKNNQKYRYRSIYNKALIFRKQKNYDSAMVNAQLALNLAVKNLNNSDKANAYNLIGTIYDQLNKNELAADYFTKALTLAKSINNQHEVLSSHLYLGIYYKRLTKTTNSLDHLLSAMKIAKSLHDSSSVFTTAINLGSMYERINDNDKALACYREALAINQSDHDENDRAICYYKLGKFFHRLKQIDSAKFYLLETQKIHEKRNDQAGLIFDFANMAGFNLEEKNYELAEKNYFKALDLGLKDGDTNKLNLLYSYIGTLYDRQNKYDQAIKYFRISLSYVNQTVPRETVMQTYLKLSEIYVVKGNYKDAYIAYKHHKAWSDSVFNVTETRKQTELKLNYEFDQIQKKIEEENKAREIRDLAELDKQRLQRNYLLGGFLIISIFLIITIKNVRAKQRANLLLHKQKKEIEIQKKIVEEKNQEINDSINYAKRIQTATTPRKQEIDACLDNYDFLFKPKDVVSGDFYWVEKTGDCSLIAVADCTGHGVPGAITSTIGCILLNEIFHEKRFYRPDQVLRELNRLVKLTLRQEEDSQTNDGMDIAFCMLNTKTLELFYAGANRPLYILNKSKGLMEYKPSKVSIGGKVALIQQYDLNTIQLEKGDLMILSTDGFADQFGGPKEKKLTTRAFKNFLNNCIGSSPADLKQKLEEYYELWRGSNEQTDDILVFIVEV